MEYNIQANKKPIPAPTLSSPFPIQQFIPEAWIYPFTYSVNPPAICHFKSDLFPI